ncbi:MAG TPA: hypothetical protein VJP76_00890 [Candidatus Tumulicola sp.]|nr:hypothetical protein [Candidatus Tumulicola sp.]
MASSVRYVLLGATLALAACASGGPLVPAAPLGAGPAAGAERALSSDGTSDDLLYVSDFASKALFVYSYPQGRQVGHLTGIDAPAGLCSDAHGTVFVTQPNSGKVLVFRHGGRHARSALAGAPAPIACSVDPVSGDLAVANQGPKNGFAQISIYAGARGTPVAHVIHGMNQSFAVAYDAAGDLFVDGISFHQRFRLAEMPEGAQHFTRLSVDRPIADPGNVQWDGTYLAIGDRADATVYRFKVAGGAASEVSSTKLGNALDTCQFWIRGKTLVGPNFSGGNVMYWSYPRGGQPTKTIGGLQHPFGVTISTAG